MEWRCFKCKEKLVEEDVQMVYEDIPAFIKGLKCPSCGAVYFTEEKVMGEILEGEGTIDAKL